jgi:hypothetical protein
VKELKKWLSLSQTEKYCEFTMIASNCPTKEISRKQNINLVSLFTKLITEILTPNMMLRISFFVIIEGKKVLPIFPKKDLKKSSILKVIKGKELL